MLGAVGGEGEGARERERESEKARKREGKGGGGAARVRRSYAEVHKEGPRLADLPILDLLGAVLQPVSEHPGKA